MSEALEALKTLRENVRSDDGQIWRQGIRDNDRTRKALTVLMDFASAALEQPSTVEPVGWRTENFDTDKSATTYDPVVAERWRQKGWPVEPLYASPPSTAEAQARALEIFAGNLDGFNGDRATIKSAMLEVAQRIREEG